jgi:hypothetical protein
MLDKFVNSVSSTCLKIKWVLLCSFGDEFIFLKFSRLLLAKRIVVCTQFGRSVYGFLELVNGV